VWPLSVNFPNPTKKDETAALGTKVSSNGKLPH
jgi:hypothetical protein